MAEGQADYQNKRKQQNSCHATPLPADLTSAHPTKRLEIKRKEN
ncbi:MAG: hypothetical protein ACTSYG_03135 [Candidatus Heimdallarchaeota archaeon]